MKNTEVCWTCIFKLNCHVLCDAFILVQSNPPHHCLYNHQRRRSSGVERLFGKEPEETRVKRETRVKYISISALNILKLKSWRRLNNSFTVLSNMTREKCDVLLPVFHYNSVLCVPALQFIIWLQFTACDWNPSDSPGETWVGQLQWVSSSSERKQTGLVSI